MTKDEAEKDLLIKENEVLDDFCPLINATCKPKCICLMPARIVMCSDSSYQAVSAYCDNAMFSPDRNCNCIL